MDPVTLVYYGAICACLAIASPKVSPALLRFAVGVAVGLAAAALLPVLRRSLGI